MNSPSDTGSMPIWTVPGYRHERELGSGATGRVVLARHEATGTPVAIKYLVRLLHSAPDFRAAYRSEAMLLGELQSPHVARLYEYVEGEQGAAIVMELVEGIALRELLQTEGATTPEAALVVLKGSLLGLAAAHEAGVVHRDYKPENVLVTAQGASKLVDFGIAARSGDVGAAAGTPLYMAPEQFSGEPAQPPTDVYAATATFFECVTGSRPYSGTTVMELMIQHTQSPIPDEQAPEHVRSLIRSGLAKTPQDRPASAAAFVEALEDVARAGYGEDWEERGQRKLATLVAMLPLLLLSAAPDIPSATTSLATTDLGSGPPPPPNQGPDPQPNPDPDPEPSKSPHPPHHDHSRHYHSPSRRRGHRLTGRIGKALIGSVVAGLTIGGIAAVAATSGGGSANDASPGTVAAGYGATSGATTSVAPTSTAAIAVTPPSASATLSPSPSASPSPTSTVSPGTAATATTAPSGTSSSPTASVTATSTPTPTPSTSPTPTPSASPPPTLHVRSVSITSYGCSANEVDATVQVQSDGAATGTLTLTWYYTAANGAKHTVKTASVTIPKGQATFVNSKPYYYDFSNVGVYWGLTVSTTPAAIRGNNSTSTVLAASCEIS
jgi:serine/threonine protein kinase